MPRDWEGLAAKHPETISSLTLLAPMGFNITALQAAKFPLLLIAGDQGRPAKDTQGAMTKLPHAELVTLKNYFSPPWADSAAIAVTKYLPPCATSSPEPTQHKGRRVFSISPKVPLKSPAFRFACAEKVYLWFSCRSPSHRRSGSP